MLQEAVLLPPQLSQQVGHGSRCIHSRVLHRDWHVSGENMIKCIRSKHRRFIYRSFDTIDILPTESSNEYAMTLSISPPFSLLLQADGSASYEMGPVKESNVSSQFAVFLF